MKFEAIYGPAIHSKEDTVSRTPVHYSRSHCSAAIRLPPDPPFQKSRDFRVAVIPPDRSESTFQKPACLRTGLTVRSLPG